MKVLFVGINNKKDCLPLDSSTKTGRIIDDISTGFEIIKTNLCPFDIIGKYPTTEEKNKGLALLEKLIEKEKPAIIVCLGNVVYSECSHLDKTIKINHPSYMLRFGRLRISEYIEAVKKQLTEILMNETIPWDDDEEDFYRDDVYL